MSAPDRLTARRKRILASLPRSDIEKLSGLERPWHANRNDLVEIVLKKWPHDEVVDAVEDLLKSVQP